MKNHPLLAQTREHLRARQYSKRTEEGYLYWIRYFLRFHRAKPGPALEDDDVRQFLAYLALERKVSPSTQATALNVLNYLYRQVLGRETMNVADFTRAPQERSYRLC